jgi:hypothetical protein
MKQIFTLLFIVCFSTAHAQFSLGMHTGTSNENIIIGLHTQYQFKNRFTAGLNMTIHADNNESAFFQSRFGYTFGKEESFSAQPYAGYSYRLQNIEQKNYGDHFTYGMMLRLAVTDMMSIYADFNVPDKHYRIFSIGISGKIPRHW